MSTCTHQPKWANDGFCPLCKIDELEKKNATLHTENFRLRSCLNIKEKEVTELRALLAKLDFENSLVVAAGDSSTRYYVVSEPTMTEVMGTLIFYSHESTYQALYDGRTHGASSQYERKPTLKQLTVNALHTIKLIRKEIPAGELGTNLKDYVQTTLADEAKPVSEGSAITSDVVKHSAWAEKMLHEIEEFSEHMRTVTIPSIIKSQRQNAENIRNNTGKPLLRGQSHYMVHIDTAGFFPSNLTDKSAVTLELSKPRAPSLKDWIEANGCDYKVLIEDLENARELLSRKKAPEQKVQNEIFVYDKLSPYQYRINLWMQKCFGPSIAADKRERNYRFFEEAGEMVQAGGMSREEAHALVDYTWGRPVGEAAQEVGGVLVTLAAWCTAHGLDMNSCGEMEAARVWTCIDKIRSKQAAKAIRSMDSAPSLP